MDYTEIKADVLVIGGGLSGLNVAIAAAEKGAQVVVMDKGRIERSGSIGGGVDHFGTYLNQGEPWDTREVWLEHAWKVGKGTTNPSVLDSVFCSELDDAIKRLARIGTPLTQPDGTFYRTQAFGQPGAYSINFNGKNLKPNLAREVRRLGCTVLDKAMAVDLIVVDGVVAGATGFNIRSGEFYVIETKAIVISTGSTNRIYENPRMNPFNCWQCPFDTGDGQVMAFKAGVALTNMEYMRSTIVPKGFSSAGLGALMGMGGRLLNSKGEYYMEKNHPMGNRAPRSQLVYYSLIELREGRSPLFIDCTHVSEADARHLVTTLGYDKDTLPDYIDQRGEDLAKKPIEVSLSEGLQCGPTNTSGSGIKIDHNCASTVPGLFAAGDCADHNRCVHGAVTGGYHAGKAAAEYALKLPHVKINIAPIEEEYEEFVAPLRRKEGLGYREVEDTIRKVMSEHVGFTRTEIGLKTGLEKLERIKEYIGLLKSNDYHELMRVHETKSILQVAEMMAQAALYRTESRIKPYHYRLDFPETDDENWCGLVAVGNDSGKVRLSFEKLTY